MALRAITTGHFDPDSYLFLLLTGQPLHEVASVTTSSTRACVVFYRPTWSKPSTGRSSRRPCPAERHVFHLLACLWEFGKLGMTSMGSRAAVA